VLGDAYLSIGCVGSGVSVIVLEHVLIKWLGEERRKCDDCRDEGGCETVGLEDI
jgi:hypothetical protein